MANKLQYCSWKWNFKKSDVHSISCSSNVKWKCVHMLHENTFTGEMSSNVLVLFCILSHLVNFEIDAKLCLVFYLKSLFFSCPLLFAFLYEVFHGFVLSSSFIHCRKPKIFYDVETIFHTLIFVGTYDKEWMNMQGKKKKWSQFLNFC